MATLNLTATDSREQTVLDHLIPIVSDTLAEKINNGVYIEKDGKRLLNKKDLSTFMAYAAEQAKKTLSEQQRTGTQAVCVHGDDIMSWAIHYFEEESIEGKLYNEDGTEYEPPKPVKKPTKATTPVIPYTSPAPKPKPQMSIFDLMDEQVKPDEKPVVVVEETDEDDEQPTHEEIQEILAEVAEQERKEKQEPKKGSPMFQRYNAILEKYPDRVVAYRLGDFYEVFGNSAVIIANELDLTLTGRDCGLDERVPMIGFPFHAADVYFAKIAQHGHKLAIAENDNDVRLMESEHKRLIDTETGEVLNDVPTAAEPNDDILMREREIAKAFDKDALIKLSDLLGNIFTLG